jgi:hypothetical protein
MRYISGMAMDTELEKLALDLPEAQRLALFLG